MRNTSKSYQYYHWMAEREKLASKGYKVSYWIHDASPGEALNTGGTKAVRSANL